MIEADATGSLTAVVFLIMTWQRPDVDPTVVALWMDILLAIVPWDYQQRSQQNKQMAQCSPPLQSELADFEDPTPKN